MVCCAAVLPDDAVSALLVYGEPSLVVGTYVLEDGSVSSSLGEHSET